MHPLSVPVNYHLLLTLMTIRLIKNSDSFFKRLKVVDRLDFARMKNFIKFMSSGVKLLEEEKKSNAIKEKSSWITDCPYVYWEGGKPQTGCLKTDYITASRNFSSMYPEAKEPLWLLEEPNLKVYFYLQGNLNMAIFNHAGRVVYRMTEFNPCNYPLPVIERIKEAFPLNKIQSVKELVNGKKRYYLVGLDKKGTGAVISIKCS